MMTISCMVISCMASSIGKPTQGYLIREEEHWVGRNVAIRERIRMWTWEGAERKLGEREQRSRGGKNREQGQRRDGELEMQTVGAFVTKTFHLGYLNTESLLFQDWKTKKLILDMTFIMIILENRNVQNRQRTNKKRFI